MSTPIRVLIVDDSALARRIISDAISRDDGIEVIGSASDVYIARDKIVRLRPDVITLDIEMPRMDGVQFLKRLMPQHPVPVIVVSALSKRGASITLDALASGAVDFVPKPSARSGDSLTAMADELAAKIRTAATTDVRKWRDRSFDRGRIAAGPKPRRQRTREVIAVGASTGGTVALTRIAQSLPSDIPGTVVVQHMPPVFTSMFADKLNGVSSVRVREARDGERLHTGLMLIAPGGLHTRVERRRGDYLIRVESGAPVSGHCPSVDVLMESVAQSAGARSIGVMLTGMGSDGSRGMLRMREAGGRTLAQDEERCVVFGMPAQAFKNGGAERLVPLDDIASEVARLAGEMSA